ncbi:outer membrane protein assembly factor BamA [Treponema sp.]|uniref:outer membrane protein assembly factor BamA n=1 Tax=Treponema sp. TaxID=166 RepID=UPI0025E0FC93|nr:outer membrane protein assembly factor BamA [Treponema sp.]MCR5219111.1 outer membrane protein assembly factor BamA [Treponema sp.]
MRFRHSFIAALVVLASFFTLPAFSQEEEWYYDKPVKSITFKNLKNIKEKDLEGITSSYIDKNCNDELIVELYGKMFALEYFQDVSIQAQPGKDKGKSVNLVISVIELPVVNKIYFKGNSDLHNSELKEVISLKEKDVFNESKLYIDERSVRNHYIDSGYNEAVVKVSKEETAEGVNVFFQISEGNKTVVKEIKFNGNVVVTAKTLKSKISLKEAGLFSEGAFQESALTADTKAIVEYYKDRGYVDARVLNVKQDHVLNKKKQREEIYLTFEIQEGSQYTFGGITFTGNKVFSTDTLNELVYLKTGDIYKESRFLRTRWAVQNLYYENGYTSNQFVPEVNKDTDNKVISYIFRIYENPRSHVEHVIINGNTKTKDYVIRREIPLEPGDIFSNAKIMTAFRSLNNLQYFSSVQPDVQQGSESDLVDIIFNVEEQGTTQLDFGFTFSGMSDPDAFPVALYAKIQNSNVFGEGRTLSLGTTLSTTEQSVNLGYGQSWLFGKPISVGFNIGYSHSTNYALRNFFDYYSGTINDDNYYMEYEQHEFSLGTSLGYRWVKDYGTFALKGGVTGSIIDNIYDDEAFVPYDSSISQYCDNWEPKNSVWSSFSFDARDSSYDPSTGWFGSQRLAWYGLLPQGFLPFAPDWGEKEFYLRTDTKLERYFTLLNLPVSETWNFKLVLMGYTGLSMQFPFFDSSIKRSNQLYIDGMFNGRGWEIYNTDAGRGCTVWSNYLELRMPLVPGVLAIDGFFDAIAIKDSVDDFFNNLCEDDWYYSFGPSIRFTIPQLPIRLLFANTFKVENGEVVWCDQDGDPNSNKWYSNFHFKFSFTNINY